MSADLHFRFMSLYLHYNFFECDHVFRFMTSDSHSFLLHCKANASLVTVQQKKKRGRGPTELRKIYDRDQPKQKVELNEFGQPVGSNGKTFANFIGTLVRKQLSVLIED